MSYATLVSVAVGYTLKVTRSQEASMDSFFPQIWDLL